ncbi:MAG: UDP-N-acetylglucosamine acyltransferase [Bacteroidetes bacterium]|nr:UDP-N-acetylglucosamine acyltransferase [Bacteroidota bacterium]
MNQIHPTAIIGDGVILGEGNIIGPFTVIYGNCIIGNNNQIGPNVVVGTPGQDTKNPNYRHENYAIKIGNNNIIREFCSIQKPIEESHTIIGDDCYLMHGVHIAHDCEIQDKVVLGSATITSGFTKILKGANIGIGTKTHQFSVIGQYAFVAMGTNVVKNIAPFAKYVPGPKTINEYALKKYGMESLIEEVTNWYIHGVEPLSKVLKEINDEFLKYHEQSHRRQH